MKPKFMRFDWVHPSYRDLVIEELAADETMRQEYLTRGGLAAVQLALSDAGGVAGERRLPLMRTPGDWVCVRDSCLKFLESRGTDYPLLELFASSADAYETIPLRLSALIVEVATALCEKWNTENREIGHLPLSRYFGLGNRTLEELPHPKLDVTWLQVHGRFLTALDENSVESGEFTDELMRWASMVGLITRYSPQTLLRNKFPANQATVLGRIIDIVSDMLKWEPSIDDPDEARQERDRYAGLARTLEELSATFPESASKFEDLSESAALYSDELSSKIYEPDDEDQTDYRAYQGGGKQADFDIEGLFNDL